MPPTCPFLIVIPSLHGHAPYGWIAQPWLCVLLHIHLRDHVTASIASWQSHFIHATFRDWDTFFSPSISVSWVAPHHGGSPLWTTLKERVALGGPPADIPLSDGSASAACLINPEADRQPLLPDSSLDLSYPSPAINLLCNVKCKENIKKHLSPLDRQWTYQGNYFVRVWFGKPVSLLELFIGARMTGYLWKHDDSGAAASP